MCLVLSVSLANTKCALPSSKALNAWNTAAYDSAGIRHALTQASWTGRRAVGSW